MDTKSLLYGLAGFFIGGFIVSLAASAANTPKESSTKNDAVSMHVEAEELKNKNGDDFDKAFIDEMITHHQGAIDMAKLSDKNAKHKEIKELSKEIISAQKQEIDQLKQWQNNWEYTTDTEHAH